MKFNPFRHYPPVLHRELKDFGKKKIIKLANKWADYFIKSEYVEYNQKEYELFNKICLLKWQSVKYVHRICIDNDPLNKACHNKKYLIDDILHKSSINEGFYSPAIYIPDICDTLTYKNFIEVPKKYIPLLAETEHSFNKVIFYKSDCDIYYNEYGPNLYINTFYNDDPRLIIYELIAKKYIPIVKPYLYELKIFQDIKMSYPEKTSDSIEQKFIDSYISYKMGWLNDSLFKSFLFSNKIS